MMSVLEYNSLNHFTLPRYYKDKKYHNELFIEYSFLFRNDVLKSIANPHKLPPYTLQGR